MPLISGQPDLPAGHMHASGDAGQTATAAGAGFQPSRSNRLTNKFARQQRPQLASFVHGVRQLGLSLRQDGDVPLSGSGATRHGKLPGAYLAACGDGHRIRMHSERRPLLARLIANALSAGYDRGAGGAGYPVLSTWQHALVGVYRAGLASVRGNAALAVHPAGAEQWQHRVTLRRSLLPGWPGGTSCDDDRYD
jgi:hypothetical protein